MPTNHSRRDVLKTGAASLAGIALGSLFAPRLARADEKRKKVLFFTKSAGFQHSVITRPESDPTKLAYAEQILTDLGANNGFDVTCSKDGRVFTPDVLRDTDVFVFYTTGRLDEDSDKYATKKGPGGKPVPDTSKLLHHEPAMPPGVKEAFLDAIKNGKGFVGFHAATDTFHSPKHVKGQVNLLRNVDDQGRDQFDPYIEMIGGEFIIHGKQQPATLKTIDPKFPGAAAFDGASFPEEWYSLKNFQPDLHVILAQETNGMTGPMYERALYPETWARTHGKGRVFYTSMGHREDVWQKPEYIALVLSALRWTSGQIEADVTPNIQTTTPGAEVTSAAK